NRQNDRCPQPVGLVNGEVEEQHSPGEIDQGPHGQQDERIRRRGSQNHGQWRLRDQHCLKSAVLPRFSNTAVKGAHGDSEIVEEGEADQREAEVVAALWKHVAEFVVRNESREVVKSRNSKKSFQNLQRESDAVAAGDGYIPSEKGEDLPQHAL